MFEAVPKLQTTRCKLIAKTIHIALSFSPWMVTGLLYYLFDWFFAIGGLVISYIVTGIIRARMRSLSIPKQQQEHDYSDEAIARWYTVKWIC